MSTAYCFHVDPTGHLIITREQARDFLAWLNGPTDGTTSFNQRVADLAVRELDLDRREQHLQDLLARQDEIVTEKATERQKFLISQLQSLYGLLDGLRAENRAISESRDELYDRLQQNEADRLLRVAFSHLPKARVPGTYTDDYNAIKKYLGIP